MSRKDRCGDCRFWIPINEDKYRGACQAMPPAMAGQLQVLPAGSVSRESAMEAVWPITRSPQWCGKFEESQESAFKKAEAIRQRYVDEATKKFAQRIIDDYGPGVATGEIEQDLAPFRYSVGKFIQDELDMRVPEHDQPQSDKK